MQTMCLTRLHECSFSHKHELLNSLTRENDSDFRDCLLKVLVFGDVFGCDNLLSDAVSQEFIPLADIPREFHQSILVLVGSLLSPGAILPSQKRFCAPCDVSRIKTYPWYSWTLANRYMLDFICMYPQKALNRTRNFYSLFFPCSDADQFGGFTAFMKDPRPPLSLKAEVDKSMRDLICGNLGSDLRAHHSHLEGTAIGTYHSYIESFSITFSIPPAFFADQILFFRKILEDFDIYRTFQMALDRESSRFDFSSYKRSLDPDLKLLASERYPLHPERAITDLESVFCRGLPGSFTQELFPIIDS